MQQNNTPKENVAADFLHFFLLSKFSGLSMANLQVRPREHCVCFFFQPQLENNMWAMKTLVVETVYIEDEILPIYVGITT